MSASIKRIEIVSDNFEIKSLDKLNFKYFNNNNLKK